MQKTTPAQKQAANKYRKELGVTWKQFLKLPWYWQKDGTVALYDRKVFASGGKIQPITGSYPTTPAARAALCTAADKIIEAHQIGADADAGFDAGEWSGPAHADMEFAELETLASAHGMEYQQLMELMWVEHAAAAGPHGQQYHPEGVF